jgi:o-succinylbenzoate synthase
VKLAGFRLHRYHLPLAEPLQLKGTMLRHREGLLVKLARDGGAAGWGEAAPLPGFSREGIEEVAGQLRALIPRLLDRELPVEWRDLGAVLTYDLEASHLAPSARFALELAVCNLLATASGTTLPWLLSPRPRETVRINALLSGPPEHVLEDACRLREAGYEAFKLKVGTRGLREDAALVRTLSERLGDGASLRLDANRAWSFEEAGEFARATAEVRLEYVEEPLADPKPLPDLARQTGLPVALDESLVGMEPETLEDHGYARALVLKPTLLGGISRTLRFADVASRLGMKPVISSAYETGVGTAALVALAAGLGGEEVPAGLDTYRRLAEDVLNPPLDLPAPSVDVRVASRREIYRPLLAYPPWTT